MDEFGKKIFTGLAFKQLWGIPNHGSLGEREVKIALRMWRANPELVADQLQVPSPNFPRYHHLRKEKAPQKSSETPCVTGPTVAMDEAREWVASPVSA